MSPTNFGVFVSKLEPSFEILAVSGPRNVASFIFFPMDKVDAVNVRKHLTGVSRC